MPASEKVLLHALLEAEVHEMATSFDKDLPSPRARRWKKRLPHYVPGLHAQPTWPAEALSIATTLQSSASAIANEIAALYSDKGKWKPVGQHTLAQDEKLVLNGTWVDASIYSAGRFNEELCAVLVQTCGLLKSHMSFTTNPSAAALVSELKPGTEVDEHVGQTNAQLTLHLGLR